MKTVLLLLLTLSLYFINLSADAQCADNANIFTFTYNGNNYEIVKENLTWNNAALCAVERGGFLARIDNQEEQDAIFNNVIANAGIDVNNTIAPDGGNASYVWLGANDMATEGVWIWDGDNDGTGDQFWQGNYNGNPVGGLYNNWGDEPDDWNGQDGLGLALTQWPIGTGTLGSASQWNDIDDSNTLYYIIEYEGTTGILEENFSNRISISPNPAFDKVFFSNNTSQNIIKVYFYNKIGQLVKSEIPNNLKYIDISTFKSGLYYMMIESDQGQFSRKKLLIKSK